MNENNAIAAGYIYKLFDTVTVSASFKKREVIIQTGEDGEEFRELLKVEFVQSKTDLLNTYKVGDKINVYVNLSGREWVNDAGVAKYFTTLKGWKIKLMEVGADPISNPETNAEPPADSFADDLPF